MRILLDESLPKKLGFLLEGHFVRTVQQMGFGGLGNSVITLVAANNKLESFLPLVPKLLSALAGFTPKSFLLID